MPQYTDDQLRAAFKLVQNKTDWKKPVRATVKDCADDQVNMIESAIMHFTGTIPSSERKGKDVKFTAAGYYMMGC